MSTVQYCQACGYRYNPDQMLSAECRSCHECGNVRWFNPAPVSVMLQPVYWHTADVHKYQLKTGLLVGQRAIQPGYGQWGLPGGFVQGDSSYEAGALREMNEEVPLRDYPDFALRVGLPKLEYSASSTSGDQILSFCRSTKSIPLSWLRSFVANRECSAVRVVWEPEQLCFPTHTEAVRRFFAQPEPHKHENLMELSHVADDWRSWVAEKRRECQHVMEDAPDLYDYHKREDFTRCAKCGHTV